MAVTANRYFHQRCWLACFDQFGTLGDIGEGTGEVTIASLGGPPWSIGGAGLIHTREALRCDSCHRTIRKGNRCYRLREGR